MFGKKRIDADRLPTYTATRAACPICGTVVEDVTGILNTEQGPKEGDGLFCAGCCSTLQFTATGGLKPFTQAEYEALDATTRTLFDEWVRVSMEILKQDLQDHPPAAHEVC